MMTMEGCTTIVNFMTPGTGVLVLGRSHISHMVKMHNFPKNLLYSQASIRQTKYIIMINKEGSTKNVTFMTPRAAVLVLGRGHKTNSENALFL